MNDAGGELARMRWRRLDWPGWVRRAVAAAYLALLTGALIAPGSTFEEVDGLFAHDDKVVHVALFLALALLARWSLPGGAVPRGVDAWLRYGVPAALALYACSAEVVQPLVGGKGRTFEWLDMASNVAGLCCGWLLFGAAIARGGSAPPDGVRRGSPVDVQSANHGGAVR